MDAKLETVLYAAVNIREIALADFGIGIGAEEIYKCFLTYDFDPDFPEFNNTPAKVDLDGYELLVLGYLMPEIMLEASKKMRDKSYQERKCVMCGVPTKSHHVPKTGFICHSCYEKRLKFNQNAEQ